VTELANLRAGIAEASRFVQATWQQAVMGAIQLPGVPEIRANIALRQLYAENIVLGDQLAIPEAGLLKRFVIATKSVARDLEYGKGPWDMKPMLLSGPKARISKNGTRYNIIPFRHGTSAAHGRNAHFKPMPKDILGQAKALKPSFAMMAPTKVRMANGKIQTSMQPKGLKWGESLQGTEKRYPAGQNPTTGYQHKAGIYEGMYRIRKRYEKATQSKYMTFRVVSDKSDPSSWWHPGYKAHHIAAGVKQYCQPGVEAIIKDAAHRDMIPMGGLSTGMMVTWRHD